jgi:spore germination cell wall hydrolase CwlJ-like protein
MTGIECLALALYFEARSEDVVGKLAVAEVIYNRVEDTRFPNDICSVVWQNKQFSWTHDGKSDVPKEKEVYKDILRLANDIDEWRLFLNHGATHYHAEYVEPYWAKHLTYVGQAGTHKFYRWD